LIRQAIVGSKEVEILLKATIEELRTAMFLAGAKTILDLARTPTVVIGSTREWLSQRGFDTSAYAKRHSI
jgi:isopentenyl-diphosphate delta-isomerase